MRHKHNSAQGVVVRREMPMVAQLLISRCLGCKDAAFTRRCWLVHCNAHRAPNFLYMPVHSHCIICHQQAVTRAIAQRNTNNPAHETSAAISRATQRSGGGGLTGRILWPTPCDRRTVAVPVPIRAPLWTGCERSRGGHTDHLPPGIQKRGCSSQRCDTATWQRASSRDRVRQTASCWACQHLPVGSDRGSH